MIYWPKFLTRPEQTYSSSFDPRLAVTEFDRNFRQRKKYTNDDEVISVAWNFTQLKFDLFRTFVGRKLVNGSLEFTTDIIGLDGISSRIVKIQGGKFTYRYQGDGNALVSAVLIGKEAPEVNEDIYEFMLELDTAEFASFVDTCDILTLYIEEFFGDSSASPEITQFLQTYS